MRLLFIESSILPSRGGVPRVTWALAEYLKKKGFEIYYIYSIADFSLVDSKNKLKTRKYDDANTIIKYVTDNKIDIVINQVIVYSSIYRSLKYLHENSTVKIIFCLHGMPEFYKFVKRDYKYYIKKIIGLVTFRGNIDVYSVSRIAKLADKIMLLSPSYENSFRKIYLDNNDISISALANPLPFDYILGKDELINKKKQVVIIARIEEIFKNIIGALEIWKSLEKVGYNGWNLILCGYGPDEKRIVKYAEQIGLKNFSFIGKTDNPQKLYNESSIFMMTSRCEGFPMTLLECLQTGCVPIVYDAFSSVYDIIDNGYNGYIISNEDKDAYAKNLYKLMNDKDVLEMMQGNCIESAYNFTTDKLGQTWVDILNGMQTKSC